MQLHDLKGKWYSTYDITNYRFSHLRAIHKPRGQVMGGGV